MAFSWQLVGQSARHLLESNQPFNFMRHVKQQQHCLFGSLFSVCVCVSMAEHKTTSIVCVTVVKMGLGCRFDMKIGFTLKKTFREHLAHYCLLALCCGDACCMQWKQAFLSYGQFYISTTCPNGFSMCCFEKLHSITMKFPKNLRVTNNLVYSCLIHLGITGSVFQIFF